MTRSVKRAKVTQPETGGTVINHTAKCEMDTRADTSCVGSNFRILEYTGQTCDFYPFHSRYKSIKNVPVVQAVTAYDDDNGNTHLLVLDEVLFLELKWTIH